MIKIGNTSTKNLGVERNNSFPLYGNFQERAQQERDGRGVIGEGSDPLKAT